MHIEPIEGEPFRYYVTAQEYLCDLRANYGVGWCDCPDFKFRRGKGLDNFNRLPKDADAWRCKHLLCVRRAYGPTIDSDMAKLGKLRKY